MAYPHPAPLTAFRDMSDDDPNMRPRPENGPVWTGGGSLPYRLLGWLPWIAAAGLALLAGFFGEAYFAARVDNAMLRQQEALSAIERKSLLQRMEAERILAARRIAGLLTERGPRGDLSQLQVVPLEFPASGTPPALAVAIWDPVRQDGELAATQLPALGADKDYQLWIAEPDNPTPVSAGAFAVDPATREARIQFKPARPVSAAARFIITIERKGGAPRADGPVVLSSR
jgi:hypothetical protein